VNDIILSIIPSRAHAAEIKVESNKEPRFFNVISQFFAQLATESGDWVLARLYSPSEAPPMIGIPDVLSVITQLKQIATIIEHNNGC
jgi:hypothetical protein